MKNDSKIALPEPKLQGMLEDALKKRASVRSYSTASLSLDELSALLFAAQGITHKKYSFSMRAVPSAGALYPIDLYVFASRVSGLGQGIYMYEPQKHELAILRGGNSSKKLANACLGQEEVEDAAAVFVYCYAKERIEPKYGKRSRQYALIEAGASSQNVALACTALNIGSVIVGAFDETAIGSLLGVSCDPLVVQPVGKTK